MKKISLIVILLSAVFGQNFDVKAYDILLKTYVDNDGFVDYAGIKKNEMKTINRLANQIAEMSPKSHPENYKTVNDQKAYWFNTYNLLIIKKIVDNYPTKSIKDIYWPGARVWITNHKVGKEDLSFNNIEHDIIRPTYKDFRIHFAINCASYGCPKLQNTAFTSENVEELLNNGKDEFFNNPRNFKVNRDEQKIYLSEILKWFKEDFYSEEKGETVKTFLVKHAPKNIADIVMKNPSFEIAYIEYDWNLNEQK